MEPTPPIVWLKWERLASPYLYCLPRHITSKNMACAFYNYLGWTLYHSNLERVRHIFLSLSLFLLCVCITVQFAPNSFSKKKLSIFGCCPPAADLLYINSKRLFLY